MTKYLHEKFSNSPRAVLYGQHCGNVTSVYDGIVILRAIHSAGLSMWQEWQMPQASGLRVDSGSRKILSVP